MIRISGLKKSYGAQVLFEDVTFSLQPGERLGLVGRNGHGKSTLFKILIKEEHEDAGEIFIPKSYRIGHLSQHLKFTEPNILAEVCLALPEYEGGWKEEYKAEAMLSGLGFRREDFGRSAAEFSGGFQIRLNIAKLLLSEPNLLLLDEPTNYLDIVAVRWLKTFLKDWPGELMLITHDREFMDSITTHTMTIHRQRAKKLAGGTEKLYSQILQEEEIYEQTRQTTQKKRREVEKFVERFRAKASKAKAVQSRVKMLERMEVGSELDDIQTLEFRFREKPFPGKFILHANDLSFSYGPNQPELISDLSFSIRKEDRIAVIGPNGRGKTTLLSLVASENRPTKGEVSYSSNTNISYFGQTNINRLTVNNTVEEEFLATDPEHNRGVARSVAGLMMFEGDLALKKIKFLSGGERSRVLLGKILLSPSNLLLLDEPTNHLDMESIESLMEAVEEFQGAMMIVTHSEEIIRRIANRLIVFDRGKVELFEGGYDEFLSRIGWEGEEDDQPKKKEISGEEKRNLQKQLAKCEKAIAALEKSMASTQSEIERAVGEADKKGTLELSERLKEIEEEIEIKFKEMEEIDQKLREHDLV